LNDSGIACCAGKPEAGELVYVARGVADDIGLSGADVAGCDAVAASCTGPMDASAMGSFFVAGEGVSTNMMEGPGASTVATAVRGVGLDVNFGNECSLMGGAWVIARPGDDEDSCDEELATLRVFFVLLPDLVTAVSDATVPG
jgi:hypothetical protein